MAINSAKFKILSLDVRGLSSPSKRKAVLIWLKKQNADIAFLPETYSTKVVENVWSSQWEGNLVFAHGTEHAPGVLVLIKKDLQFELKQLRCDINGRFILLEVIIQDVKFYLCNIYSPNNSKEQIDFFTNVKNLLQENISETNPHFILGGDFNVIFDTSLDCFGGNPKIKDCVKIVNDIMVENDLVDIWRIRNVGKNDLHEEIAPQNSIGDLIFGL